MYRASKAGKNLKKGRFLISKRTVGRVGEERTG
jgi:hypothetical protein